MTGAGEGPGFEASPRPYKAETGLFRRNASFRPGFCVGGTPSVRGTYPKQKDQDRLPPYEVLDPTLKAHMEEGKSVDDM